MKSLTLVAVLVMLTLCCTLVPAASATTATTDDPTFYRFVGDRLPEPGTLTTARIVVEVDGRVLFTQRYTFRLDAGDSAVLPLPVAVPSVLATDGARLHVYAQDTLFDSFSSAGLASYNRHLLRTDDGTLAELLKEWKVPPAGELGVAAASPGEDGAGVGLVTAAFSQCEQDCSQQYFSCSQSCIDPACQDLCDEEYNTCTLGCPEADSDGDGVENFDDNCDSTPNADQANCDGDAFGDACDSLNATYQTTIAESTCMTDKDTHVGYFTFEHHVEWYEEDVSSCNAPARWRRRVRDDNDCFNISDFNCCAGLDASINAVGDSTLYWCDASVRDTDFCH